MQSFLGGAQVEKAYVERMITALFRHYSRLREFYYESGQSDKLEPMKQHIEELEVYLKLFGLDRNVMPGSRVSGIEILLSRLLAVNGV